MTELRTVDPQILKPDPENSRRIKATPAMDEQLRASILAIGIIQPPVVREKDGELVIKAGERRVKQAILAGLSEIEILVRNSDDKTKQMVSLSENVIRASMNPVDLWRGIERLIGLGWNERAISDALALPVRTVKRLRLLSKLHPPILDVMARGDMPGDEQIRAIAAAAIDEQAQVWKKHKPRKNEETNWWAVANALAKRRIPFSAAKFDDELGAKYGVVWHDDLFAPADEDGRYTTDVDGFFGAQQEWLENNLPKGGAVVPHDEYGHPQLPKKAQHVYGKAHKGDITGYCLDPRTAEVKTIVYRLAAETKAGKGGSKDEPTTKTGAPKSRPDVTQKGNAIIGDLRTDALHEALRTHDIEDTTLIALLVLALGGGNVSVQSGVNEGRFDRETLCDSLVPGGALTADHAIIRSAARQMLTATLSCRDNMSNSGIGARVAGETIGAALRLPSMATDEFLSCLSRQALEREARANGVRVEARVKDTRARLVTHFAASTWHYPGALFKANAAEIKDLSPGGLEDDQTGEGDDPELGAEGTDRLAEAELADAPQNEGDDLDHHALPDAAD